MNIGCHIVPHKGQFAALLYGQVIGGKTNFMYRHGASNLLDLLSSEGTYEQEIINTLLNYTNKLIYLQSLFAEKEKWRKNTILNQKN